ncbi:hypothetical protein FRC17_002343 [Serendipita sp. 399]|nr:hypothetical protein FRC17_002343 [Serendipita sp. 399]
MVACGEEARVYIGDEAYEVAKWFKLHLHYISLGVDEYPPPYCLRSDLPPSPRRDSLGTEMPPLPSRVTLATVYAHFLRYMFDGVHKFFKESIPNGAAIWKRLSLSGNVIIVLAIPNGWDMGQQSFLKRAAQQAGIVQSEQDADLRIEFVSEGEASVHYALAKVNCRPWIQKGIVFAVTDAGGSTVDSTLYICKEVLPKLVLEEVCASECVQAGGVFVDRALSSMLSQKLAGSKYGDNESIEDMVKIFEQRARHYILLMRYQTDVDKS